MSRALIATAAAAIAAIALPAMCRTMPRDACDDNISLAPNERQAPESRLICYFRALNSLMLYAGMLRSDIFFHAAPETAKYHFSPCAREARVYECSRAEAASPLAPDARQECHLARSEGAVVATA